MSESERPLWIPSSGDEARANLTRFVALVRERCPDAPAFESYDDLWAWSVRERERFWPLVWEWGSVVADRRADGSQWDEVLVGRDRMAPPDDTLGPKWFTGARLNFAENLLRWRDDRDAIAFWNETGHVRTLTHAQLYDEVARVASALRAMGIVAGDRVAGFMPNIPETIIAMLAAASIGAVWSSCSPDFGVGGVLDRFGQIEPRVLFCAASYQYNGKRIDCLERVREIAERIPSIERVIVVDYWYGGPGGSGPGAAGPNVAGPEGRLASIRAAVAWSQFTALPGPPDRARSSGPASSGPQLTFERGEFDHPLYIMYSSGTTGLPKCMVHGAGGTLLQHIKELSLHTDLTRDDRIFYFTTCGWMMWNWLVSSLAVGATVVLYDGAPLYRRGTVLWDMAAQERVSIFGTSAKWIALIEKEGLVPRETHDLSALRAILSTGSPLAAHSFDYVYRDVKPGVRLSSISGGTDIISCFALGNPTLPVWRGELQCRGLGMAVEIFDEEGNPVVGEAGELVCTAPFPSMPVRFWNDADGAKYRAAYFDFFPNTWRHGDWAELTPRGGLVIHGRSDATLNPGGVRIGTAEIYRQVEQLPEIIESLVIGQEMGDDVRVVLFVRLAEGAVLDDALRDRICRRIRENASPHHVPKRIVAVADIPRTISGKITELAVRDVVHGRPVKNVDALANPQALELFRDLPELTS